VKGTIACRSRAVLLFERGGREAFGRVAVMTANGSIPRAGRLASGYPPILCVKADMPALTSCATAHSPAAGTCGQIVVAGVRKPQRLVRKIDALQQVYIFHPSSRPSSPYRLRQAAFAPSHDGSEPGSLGFAEWSHFPYGFADRNALEYRRIQPGILAERKSATTLICSALIRGGA